MQDSASCDYFCTSVKIQVLDIYRFVGGITGFIPDATITIFRIGWKEKKRELLMSISAFSLRTPVIKYH